MAEENINVLMLRMLMRMEQQRLGAKERAEQQRRDELLTPEKAQEKTKTTAVAQWAQLLSPSSVRMVAPLVDT